MSPQSQDQLTAVATIQQAIREDHLWMAAWLLVLFIKKPNKAFAAFLGLESTAQKHALEDITDWFENGFTFEIVKSNSWKKHTTDPDLLSLRDAIAIYCRATGFLGALILMAKQPAKMTDATQEMEMEAMGSVPNAKAFQCNTLEDDGWTIVRKEEAQKGEYLGSQWSMVKHLDMEMVEIKHGGKEERLV
ncbi:hypothetical protein Pst134EA_024117 [Puccinia striiformis f. sp. tritici]|uniref:hypothetical protein n=1 Tax=Puccinia striiformis f. sp. tritici TaxID=168172 RepID=UPI002007937F|nr:hypothetical protein Pst134EA_024117 [Puccinia striiformis f. sp. tritici]KAH9453233.1 hypothetical protein Pst134EA_024117 [Puccinia striiformis f. sp. tritici]